MLPLGIQRPVDPNDHCPTPPWSAGCLMGPHALGRRSLGPSPACVLGLCSPTPQLSTRYAAPHPDPCGFHPGLCCCRLL